jgi:hypothetical protein
MAQIVWIASYPRSGNTWLRFLLANLIRREEIESSAQVRAVVPDIHEGIAGAHLWRDGVSLIKTHWAFKADFPLREDTVGVIQLVRHPVDTLESNQNYLMNRGGKAYAQATPEGREREAAKFVDEFIRDGGHRKFVEFGIGTLEQHILSWSPRNLPFPRLLVRYEDLKADTAGQLARLCRFLKMQRSDEEISQAVDRASIARMRQIEESEISAKREGMFYQTRNRSALEAGHRLVGRSSTGESRYRLTGHQRARAEQRFAALIQLLGYHTGGETCASAADDPRPGSIGGWIGVSDGATS